MTLKSQPPRLKVADMGISWSAWVLPIFRSGVTGVTLTMKVKIKEGPLWKPNGKFEECVLLIYLRSGRKSRLYPG